jgi:hypothetical protein
MREPCPSTDLPGREPRDRGAGKDRAIDPMSGKNTSAKKEPDPARAFWVADGRQPFMPASVSRPLPSIIYPFGSPMRGGCGRFLSGVIGAFHPAIGSR